MLLQPVFSKPWKIMNYRNDKNAWKNKVWEYWSLAMATITYNYTKKQKPKTMICHTNIYIFYCKFEEINWQPPQKPQ